jgi:hypothetical protein
MQKMTLLTGISQRFMLLCQEKMSVSTSRGLRVADASWVLVGYCSDQFYEVEIVVDERTRMI